MGFRQLHCWLVLFALAAMGCDVRLGDSYSPTVGENSHFTCDGAYAEYYLLIYNVEGYRDDREIDYFARSLELARPVLERMPNSEFHAGVQFVVVVVRDLAGRTRSTHYRSARLFRREDVVSSDADLAELARTTPREPPPYFYQQKRGEAGMTVARQIIEGHAAARKQGDRGDVAK